MSKAFTREDDDAPESPAATRPLSAALGGVPNYLTPDGANRLRAELAELQPRAEAGDASVAPRAARLRQILASAIVVPPPPDPSKIAFGARVRVRDAQGADETYRLVGVDEIELHDDAMSWRSPLAKALVGARSGAKVRVRLPAGDTELVIVAVTYGRA